MTLSSQRACWDFERPLFFSRIEGSETLPPTHAIVVFYHTAAQNWGNCLMSCQICFIGLSVKKVHIRLRYAIALGIRLFRSTCRLRFDVLLLNYYFSCRCIVVSLSVVFFSRFGETMFANPSITLILQATFIIFRGLDTPKAFLGVEICAKPLYMS